MPQPLTKRNLPLNPLIFTLPLQILLPSFHYKDIVDGGDVDVLDTLGSEFCVTGDEFWDLLRVTDT